MAKPRNPVECTLTAQFIAGDAIDTATGKLTGVVVAEVGTAIGHFVFLDRDGRVLGNGGADDAKNFNLVAKRVPLGADQKTLETIIEAGKVAGRVRTREDHKDTIEARVGFMEDFRLDGNRVLADCNVLDNYRNRGLLLETAQKTPELIGMSGDFKFTAEVVGDAAFMRVARIDAVDLVDEGAITHSGLFRALPPPPVDNKTTDKSVTPTLPTMAKKDAVPADQMPDLDEFAAACAAVKKMHDAYKAHLDANEEMSKAVATHLASIVPVNVPTPKDAPAPTPPKPGNPDAAIPDKEANFSALRDEVATLKAQLAALPTTVSDAVKAQGVEMQKQFAALGIKPADTPKPGADITKTNPAKVEPKDFLSLKASVMKDRKVDSATATRAIISENPEVWTAYQVKLGIIKAA